MVGTLNLDGIAHLRAVETVADIYLVNRQLTPPSWSATLLRPDVRLPIHDIRELSYPINRFDLIPPIDVPTPYLSAPVVSFFGLLDVVVHAQASVGVGVTLEGYIKPLKPELQATLISTARAGAELGVGLRLLQGLADAGATARLDSRLDVPVTLDVLPSPVIGLDACLTLSFSVRAFASLGWGLLREDATKKLAEFTGCLSEVDAAAQAAAQADIDLAVPELLASPAIAIGPDGTQLSAYFDNVTSNIRSGRIQRSGWENRAKTNAYIH